MPVEAFEGQLTRAHIQLAVHSGVLEEAEAARAEAEAVQKLAEVQRQAEEDKAAQAEDVGRAGIVEEAELRRAAAEAAETLPLAHAVIAAAPCAHDDPASHGLHSSLPSSS